MITNNLSTLKIHKLSQEQYNRELAAGTLDANAFYLTPDEGGNESGGEVIAESGKILIGQLELNSSTLTAADDLENVYAIISDDIKNEMKKVFNILNNGFDILITEFQIADSYSMGGPSNYRYSSTERAIFYTLGGFDEVAYFIFTEDYIITNNEYIEGNMTVKFYIVSYGTINNDILPPQEEELPEVTYQDNGKVLMVVDGKWAIGPINNNTVLPGAEGASF